MRHWLEKMHFISVSGERNLAGGMRSLRAAVAVLPFSCSGWDVKAFAKHILTSWLAPRGGGGWAPWGHHRMVTLHGCRSWPGGEEAPGKDAHLGMVLTQHTSKSTLLSSAPAGFDGEWGIQGGDAQRLLGVSDGTHPKRGLGSSGQTKA